uniref:Sodium-coupled monocarboxylate transporter 1 n=2 Tax=Cyprinus carpio TaxID=7962 RepID=A0A8C2B4U8_CYPCA
MPGSGGPVATFSVWDYVVFAGLILFAAGIGLFQAIRGRKKASSDEFLLGGRQMTAVPVALSLTASFMSGITVIGTPAEAYMYGTPFWLFVFSYTIMSTFSAELFVPLFYRLSITSTYEGGLKAVIWTDVFQMIIMLSGFVAVIARGAVLQGGFAKIWNDSYHGGRLETFSFDPDPLRRHSFWTIVVGGSLMWASMYSINQSQVQRYISCKTMTHAKLSLYLNMVGLWVTVSLAMLSGLTMYSIYKDCDPFTNKDVGASDQLLPYLVMDILAEFPGLPGLFVAAAYSGTLSTVSSSINALVAVTVEDFMKPAWPWLTERQLSWINMGMSVFYGGVCIGMAGVASLMGNILQAALSIFGMISGPLLGLYMLGMFFRCVNSTGGLVGLICGLAITLWVGIGAQVYPPLPEKTLRLSLSVEGCIAPDMNGTTTMTPFSTVLQTTTPQPRPALADNWYSLSYLYFCPVGIIVTMVTGLIVSAITGKVTLSHLLVGVAKRVRDCNQTYSYSYSKSLLQVAVSDLIEKDPKNIQGLESPVFCDNEIALKEKDHKEKITKF